MDIAPKIYQNVKRKNSSVKKALENNSWVSNITVQQGFGIDHIQQFVSLWEMVSEVNLHNDVPDTIAWKFTSDGAYSAKSAYNMQFEGIVSTSLDATVWQALAPPKCNFFCMASSTK